MKLRKLSLVASVLVGITLSQQVLANVSGTVYQDLPVNGSTLNTYGVKDANELGVAGVTVTAYQADGTSQSMVTADDGLWTLATTGDVRVEFSTIPSYLKESSDGGVNNSSVQFIADGGVADFGLHDIADYSDTVNPLYVNNIQQNGLSSGSTKESLHTLNYSDTGLNADYKKGSAQTVQGTGPIPQDTIMISQIGSVWGKAYQKDKQRLFVSSMLQRHVGFANTPADVYVVDYSAGIPASLTGHLSLQGKIPSNGGGAIDLGTVDRSSSSDYTLSADPFTQSIDLDAYGKVGKVSYGDIDFDHDNNKLWLVNLNQKGIISIDASGDFNGLSSANVNQYLIESLPNVPTCAGGFLRPWALKIYQGKGFLGAICDAVTSQSITDLTAFVLSFDTNNPSAGFSSELEFSLDYEKLSVFNKKWFPWVDSYFDPAVATNGIYPEPILSDIEFDEKGQMYLAFIDRYAIQTGVSNLAAISGTTQSEGALNNGEILRVCNVNGIYEVEGSGSCSEYNYTTFGPDEFFNDMAGDNSGEGSLGSVALLKGSNELMLAFMDPHPEGIRGADYFHSQGQETLSTIDGSITNWYANIFSGYGLTQSLGGNGFNGKANGMGDIELITAPAPLELGNRVWNDTDGDGVQDAGEAGIAGINIELVCGGGVVSTATTDANGNYIFSNDPNGASTNSHKYNITALVAGVNDCLVRIPNISGGSKQAALGANNLTSADTGEGANSNQNDSDGIVSGDNAEAQITAAEIRTIGGNNHSFDFGFSSVVAPPAVGCVTINNTASITAVDQTDTDNTNDTASASIQANCAIPQADLELVKTANKTTVLKGETLIYTLTLTNKGESDATDVEVTDSLPINVTFVSATPAAGTSFDNASKVWTIPSLPAASGNNVVTLQIEVTVN